MAFEIAKGFNVLEKSLFYRRIRQDMIASNIANADTPYYKSRDIRFEDALQAEIDKEFGEYRDRQLKLAKTNPLDLEPKDIDSPFKPKIFFRDGFLERNDGNDVDIDVETTEMAKNDIAYKATIAAIKKEIQIFTLAVDSSKNL
jgi:flagellar basal-body rod protein FlgB